MSVLNENTLLGASGAGGDYEVEQSLRFNAPDTSYLSWTPASTGNNKTWTYSVWIKQSNIATATGASTRIFEAYSDNSNRIGMYFDGDACNPLSLYGTHGGVNFRLLTNACYRDFGGWMHIVLNVDTTQSTASNRIKLYINGEQITSFSTSTYPALNATTVINTGSKIHTIGVGNYDSARLAGSYFNGYMGEVNFIDGQALTPDSFGETGKYGEWKPIEYAGTYGTNGFYLPFKQDYSVEGFSTVVYEGASTDLYIGGAGFKPDLVWVKRRSGTAEHELIDSVRGNRKLLSSDTTGAELDRSYFKSFDNDGFSVETGVSNFNVNGSTYVAWNWDMGSTTASNTSGSITSSVRANTTYGQSIVKATYSGSGTQTFGHGLSAAPDMIIGKALNHAYGWGVYHSGLSSAQTKSLALNTTAAESTNNMWGNTQPTSSVFSANIGSLEDAGHPVIFYCFTSVTGYSKFGSYTGNGNATGPTVTLGFAPAFVMIKRTDATKSWFMTDNTRNPSGQVGKYNFANLNDGEYDYTRLNFTSTGFQLASTDNTINGNNNTYIYAAFADTREYAYWLDQSGNNNDWTSEGGLTESDVMVDSPTNNFAVMNPLTRLGVTGTNSQVFSQGNLRMSQTAALWACYGSTHSMTTGKYYWEMFMAFTGSGGTDVNMGMVVSDFNRASAAGIDTVGAYSLYAAGAGNGVRYDNSASGTDLGSGYHFTWGDIVQVAYDADSGKMWVAKNGTWFGSGNPATGANPFLTVNATNKGNLIPAFSQYHAHSEIIANFGSDSSFAGAKTPQGNQDNNLQGDFQYSPPSGFLALCSSNLEEATVIPSKNFNTVLYTGTRQNKVISGVGFQPDFIWLKTRSTTSNHVSVDSVRGGGKALQPNTTSTENQYGAQDDKVTAFSSDGFSLGVDAAGYGFNDNNATYVAWNWKAGGSASSNTNGTINSSVSANPSAGFSIVSYTGTGANATVGHGLASAPEMLIVKNRNATDVWLVYHDGLASDPQTDYIILNRTDVKGDTNTAWNDTAPTSTVFSLGSLADVNRNSSNLIAYCFHSVDGYSKVGSYTGNSSTDGTFVNCGFRPAYVMVKHTTVGWHWWVYDNARDTYNQTIKGLKPNHSGAEYADATYTAVDLLSNGFKWRTNEAQVNANGGKFIFLAFAESPFKHSNAR